MTALRPTSQAWSPDTGENKQVTYRGGLNGPLEESFPGFRGLPRPGLMCPVPKPDSLGVCPHRTHPLPPTQAHFLALSRDTMWGPSRYHTSGSRSPSSPGPACTGTGPMGVCLEPHVFGMRCLMIGRKSKRAGVQCSPLRAHRGAGMLWTG